MTPPPEHRPAPKTGRLRRFLGVFRYSGRALDLVRETSPMLMGVIAALTLVAGLLPAGVAYVGKLIVDAVVAASAAGGEPGAAWTWVLAELGLVALMAVAQRGLMTSEHLLRAQLGFKVNVMILERALTLGLPGFEDSEFYDKMTRARREASSRPLSLVRRLFGLVQNTISLFTYGGLLLAFSPLALGVLVVAAIPAFIAETRFSGAAFRLFRWRSTETRQQMYLETVLAREDYAKEVKLFRLGPLLLERYREIFHRLYAEDRDLTLRRGFWGATLGTLSTAAFYGAYAWIAVETIAGRITLGDMTMYLLVFKQGQSAISSVLSAINGMYEDNLYLSNLYEYLSDAAPERTGGATAGPRPDDGVRFEDVTFRYPGSDAAALDGVSLHVRPGEKLALVGENGSGKTTLIKLLAGLYVPSSGRVLIDGLEVEAWDLDALRRKIGVIFQDFVRYQLRVGENIGVGEVDDFDDRDRWTAAAEKGLALPFIDDMPEGFETQLGRWFPKGRELSIGQWQKIALSRAFMRDDADILVLDEPTAAMDAEAEMQIFERFRALTEERIAVVISHRFSTVRMADRIAVLHHGELMEVGSHEELMAEGGRYAHLFSLQAQGYL
ncbi:MAG: ABC transporter ATP-binding protein [Alphaproteobacteria bacterium]|nr:ABC transporter ATP-binding protein [Alphaproteobacteria bacterium]